VRCPNNEAYRIIRLDGGLVMKAVTLRIPPELLQRVEALAREERRPLQNMLRNLLDDGIAAQQNRGISVEVPAWP
jgi:predicted transcriptional regulator